MVCSLPFFCVFFQVGMFRGTKTSFCFMFYVEFSGILHVYNSYNPLNVSFLAGDLRVAM